MNRIQMSVALAVIFLALVNVAGAQTSWKITDNYSIEFSGRGAEGTFTGLTGTILFDPNELSSSKFDVTIDPSTISTGNKTKDKHARGESWFNVEEFAMISFISKEVTKSGDGYVAMGKLTLQGIENPAQISFTFDQNQDQATFKGEMTVNRESYGIMGPFIAFTVGDDFEVNIEANVRK